MTVPAHMLYAGASDEAIGFRSSVILHSFAVVKNYHQKRVGIRAGQLAGNQGSRVVLCLSYVSKVVGIQSCSVQLQS